MTKIEAKCSVCGATPMESEDIYEDIYGENRHRHLNECIVFLGGRIHTLECAMRKIVNCQDRWTESDVIVREMVDIAKGALR